MANAIEQPVLLVLSHKTKITVKNEKLDYVGYVPFILRPNYTLEKENLDLKVYTTDNPAVEVTENYKDLVKYSFGFATKPSEKYYFTFGYLKMFNEIQLYELGGDNTNF